MSSVEGREGKCFRENASRAVESRDSTKEGGAPRLSTDSEKGGGNTEATRFFGNRVILFVFLLLDERRTRINFDFGENFRLLRGHINSF